MATKKDNTSMAVWQKIQKLAKDRKWGVNNNCWMLRNPTENYFVIGRLGIKIYSDCLEKNIDLLDEKLVYIIRKYIPETNYVNFYLYDTVTADMSSTKKVKKTKRVIPPKFKYPRI